MNEQTESQSDVVDSGFKAENVALAEWLWRNVNVDHRRFHDLPTHHKAMLCHTAAIVRANNTLPRDPQGLVEALRELLHAYCSDTGFAAAVRQDTGKAYPWCPGEIAEAKARTALAAWEAGK